MAGSIDHNVECPFCRGQDHIAVYELEKNCWAVECDYCLVTGPRRESKAEAMEAWLDRND